QQLVPEAAIEALNEGVLGGLAGCDVVPVDPCFLRPLQDRPAGELGAVVGNTHGGSAAAGDNGVELSCDPQARERGIGHQAEALPGKVVDHSQDPETAAISHNIADEVHGPALVRPPGDRHRGSAAERPLAPTTPTHLEPLLGIEPAELLVYSAGRLPDGAEYVGAGNRTAGGWQPTPAAGRGSHYRQAAGCGSESSRDPPRSFCTPAAGSPRGFAEGELPPLVWRRASPFFCRDVLQHDVVEHGFGEKLLQLCVLGLENLQPAGIRYLQPTVPRLPLVERRAANAVLAADIRRRCPRLLLPQDGNDLLFVEPRSPHHPSPSRRRTLLKSGGDLGAQVTTHDVRTPLQVLAIVLL